MANAADTILPKLQLQYTKSIVDKTAMRGAPKPFLIETLNSGDVLDDKLQLKLRESESRVTTYNRLKLPTSVSGTARETTHTGDTPDTVQDTISWTTYTEKLDYIPQQFRDNVINGNEAMMNAISKAVDKLMSRFETLGITTLEAGRSGVNVNNGQLGTWNATNDFLEVALADIDQQPYVGVDNMYQNNYDPRYSVICDNATMALYRKLFAQGTGNNTNQGWQNFGDFDALLSNGTTLAASLSYAGVSYWWPKNSIGFYHWIPWQNRIGEGPGEFDSEGITTVLLDPRYPGVEFALSAYTKRVDGSAINASTQAYRTYLEISLDGSYLIASLDVANETIIQGLAQATS